MPPCWQWLPAQWKDFEKRKKTCCDDSNEFTYPGAAYNDSYELCMTDVDGDNYGDPEVSESSCTAPTGYVEDNTDCDDARADINPVGQEVCDPDGADEDCDGLSGDADDSVDANTKLDWYPDMDEDSYGDLDGLPINACDNPSDTEKRYSTDNTDCDDTRSDVNPGASEVCDDLDTDEDCDGTAEDLDDDNDPSTQTMYYLDSDMDSFGDEADVGGLAVDVVVGRLHLRGLLFGRFLMLFFILRFLQNACRSVNCVFALCCALHNVSFLVQSCRFQGRLPFFFFSNPADL